MATITNDLSIIDTINDEILILRDKKEEYAKRITKALIKISELHENVRKDKKIIKTLSYNLTKTKLSSDTYSLIQSEIYDINKAIKDTEKAVIVFLQESIDDYTLALKRMSERVSLLTVRRTQHTKYFLGI